MSPLCALLLSALPSNAADVARPATLGARVEGGVDVGESVGPAGSTVLTAAVPLGPSVGAEVEALFGVGGAYAPRVGGLVGLRVDLGRGFSIAAQTGGGWRPGGPLVLGRLGGGWDFPLGPVDLRVSAAAEGSRLGLGLLAGVGVTVPLERRAAPVAKVWTAPPPHEEHADAPPWPAHQDPPIQVTPPDAMVWIPHPVCAWVPADKAPALLALADPSLPIQVRAPGYLPSELPRDGSRTVTLQPAPPVGAVVVVAWPGDRVSIGDTVFPLAADGTAVFGAPEGPVRVTVTGAGRRVELEGAVAAGYALWLRAPEPPPLVVTFPAGSAEVPEDAVSSIASFATNAGTFGFRVVGSYSGESELAETRRLADRRAEALKDALIRAGVTPRAIAVLSTAPPAPGEAPDALRAARVEAILPEER